MARSVKKLSARSVTTLSKPGRHSDGDGLYLIIDQTGARRWLFLFRWQGKLKELGLGGISTTSLAEAREAASVARKLVASGVNPIVAKKAAALEKKPMTFGEFADEMLVSILPGYKNVRHQAQWKRALVHYAEPIRSKILGDVTTEDILKILQPLWHTKQETASRVRGRIERVLAAAKAKKEIAPPWENPARWRGHLKELLSQRKKLSRGHHAAMPYPDVPAFVARLRERDAAAAAALEFAIFNASRSNEVLGTQWGEIDFKTNVWTVPPERMKGGKAHRVPLSAGALRVLEKQAETKISDFVFPGQKLNRPLSSMAMEMLLRRMGASEFTQHGFRSSFRDWCGESTTFAREIAEAALSHTVGDEAEQAYRRGDALEKRRRLMEAWSQFISTPRTDAKIVPLKPVKAS